MEYTLIKAKELPKDVLAVIRECGFNGTEIKIIPCIEFKCPTNWHDYNIMRLTAYNQDSGKYHTQTSGNYDSYVSFTKEELAMYHGALQTTIPGPHIWMILTETYPKSCRVYCHPDAITKKICPPKIELTKRQEICLYITRSMISRYREEEARTFKFSRAEWATTKAELYGLGLMTQAGALTLAGKNRSQGLNFNHWEV